MTLCSPVRWFNPRDKRDRRLLSGKRNFGRVIKGENGQKVVNVLCSESRKLDQLVCAALITTIPSINGRSRFSFQNRNPEVLGVSSVFFSERGGGGRRRRVDATLILLAFNEIVTFLTGQVIIVIWIGSLSHISQVVFDKI